ncbi:MAG: hypothetical protein IPI46_10525 [Bacteroidetes bacterium]|nr:hypothetical protein [Bacteroidota bacterium]
MNPSASRDFSMMVSSFRSGNKFVVPTSLAAEIAPISYAYHKISLQEYQQKIWIRTLCKTRISAATQYDEILDSRHLSFGIRTTLLDKGDYRNDKEFLNQKVYTLLDAYENLVLARKLSYMKANRITALELAENENLSKQIEDTLLQQIISERITQSIADYKTSHWNASRLDIAYTSALSTPDSLLANAKLNKHLFWITYATKPGKKCDWAQLVFSLHNRINLSTSNFSNHQLYANTRFYFGSNLLKGFSELQFQHDSGTPIRLSSNALLFNCGLDMNLYKSIWIYVSAGLSNDLTKNANTSLQTNMKFYFALPEEFDLF